MKLSIDRESDEQSFGKPSALAMGVRARPDAAQRAGPAQQGAQQERRGAIGLLGPLRTPAASTPDRIHDDRIDRLLGEFRIDVDELAGRHARLD
ncbi:MAG: hypothetical protein OEY15_15800, partial [Myxococcales bacterium]|nr:hypothetical protein [Myxococcales bacterium]